MKAKRFKTEKGSVAFADAPGSLVEKPQDMVYYFRRGGRYFFKNDQDEKLIITMNFGFELPHIKHYGEKYNITMK